MNSARTIEVDGSGGVFSLVFLEDGKHLLSGGQDGMIRQWRVEDGMEVGEASKASTCVRAIAISGDLRWILSGEHSGATIWNRDTRQRVLTVNKHTDWVTTVDVSPDSNRFATGAMDKCVFICDILTGTRLVGPLRHDNNLTAVKFSPSGDLIATTTWTAQSLQIYDVHTGELLKTFTLASTPIEPIAWSSDSRRIFAISSNIIKHISVDTGAFERIIPGKQPLSLPRNGRYLACYVGNSLIFWDTFTGERLGPIFDQPGGRLRSVALSPDSNYLATGRNNGIITLRNFNDFVPVSNLVGGSVFQQSQFEIEALRAELHAMGLRVDELTRRIAQSSSLPQARAAPSQIPNGTYRIKSITADVYLACSQDAASTVVVQQSDQSNLAQTWSISHTVDGTYSILGRRAKSDVQLSVGNDSELVCIPGGRTTWTIDPSGDAYVIGNAVDATAIHLTKHSQRVSLVLRENSPNEHWVLEPVLNRDIPESATDENVYTMCGACEFV